MKKNHLYSFVVFTLLASLPLVAVGCSNPAETSGQAQFAPVVKVLKVGSSKSGAMASGKVEPADEIQVVSKLSGRVAAVHVKEGSVVKAGDVLVQLEAIDYIQQVKQAESGITGARARLADAQAGARSQELQRLQSGVEQAKAGLDAAQKSYDRMKSLYDTGALSLADLEKVTLELEKARTGYDQVNAQLDLAKAGATSNSLAALQSEVTRLQSSLEMAKNTLDSTRIHSPIGGIVARRNIDPGEMAQSGVPMLTVVKMDEVKITASVSQEQINSVKAGNTLQVNVGGKMYTGMVDFVSPISDQNSSTFPVKIKVKNQDYALKAGMLAEVFLSGKQENAIKVPTSAIMKKDNKTYVYKVDQNVIHQVEITTGQAVSDLTSIQNGLQANDQIVLDPSEKLKDGMTVTVN